MKTRRIHFASSILEVAYDGPSSQQVLDFLYQYLPQPEYSGPPVHPPHFTYRLSADQENGRLRLYVGDRLESEMTAAEMAVYLINQTCYHLAYHSCGGVLLHAALLSRAGKGILLPGKTGQGKSTLAAWLIHQGFDYLTDELVYIPDGSSECHGLTRPLNLKSGARPLLQTVFGLPEENPTIWRSSNVDLIPPELLGPVQVLREAPLHTILFPNFQPQATFELQPLSRAQAGLALMQCLINARNLPEHGFPEITRLSRQVPAYRITYPGFDPLPGALGQLFATS